MAEFSNSIFTKYSGNSLSSIFFYIILVGLVSTMTAKDICTQYKLLIMKPTLTFTECNVKIPVSATKSAPTIAYPEDQNIATNLTTIVMISPTGQNSVHWLRTDIPKDHLKLGTSKRSDDFYRYRGPQPPEAAGVYEYQFYLLSQPADVNISIKPYVDQYRKHFKITEFRKANQMEVLGFFQYRTEYESGSRLSSLSFPVGLICVVSAIFIGV